jgi:hypothetical protein
MTPITITIGALIILLVVAAAEALRMHLDRAKIEQRMNRAEGVLIIAYMRARIGDDAQAAEIVTEWFNNEMLRREG